MGTLEVSAGASLGDQVVDFHFTNQRNLIAWKTTSGNAPIDCIAMNSAGDVYVGENFEAHVASRVFLPVNKHNIDLDSFRIIMNDRYERLRQKMPDLVMIGVPIHQTGHTYTEGFDI